MIVLALDTATTACSAALWQGGRILAHELEAMSRGHAEALLPMVARILAAAGLRARDVDLFAVTIGPGAFTGLRVGLAAARGLALAVGRPCVGVTTLDAVAAAVPTDERRGRTVVAVLDTRRDDLFVQAFGADGEAVSEPAVVVPSDLTDRLPPGPLVVAGDAMEMARRAMAVRPDVTSASASGAPDARVVAALAAARWDASREWPPPAPLYLRAPAATQPRAGGRRRP